MCDRALDVMDELQRAGTVDPDFQAAVAAVQAVRTELTKCVRSAGLIERSFGGGSSAG
jgi:hypothetical protein